MLQNIGRPFVIFRFRPAAISNLIPPVSRILGYIDSGNDEDPTITRSNIMEGNMPPGGVVGAALRARRILEQRARHVLPSEIAMAAAWITTSRIH